MRTRAIVRLRSGEHRNVGTNDEHGSPVVGYSTLLIMTLPYSVDMSGGVWDRGCPGFSCQCPYAEEMRTVKIVQFGDPVLRQVAKPVTIVHRKIQTLLKAMTATLAARNDGAALAAPQVGVLKRLIVIDYEQEHLELINPELMTTDGEEVAYEGCLSFPGYVGLVPRAHTVRLKYMTRSGQERIIEREGRMARCIQHELDHLEGILFIDRMTSSYLIHPETEATLDVQTVRNVANGKTMKMSSTLRG